MIGIGITILVALWFWQAGQKRGENQFYWAAVGGIAYYVGTYAASFLVWQFLTSDLVSVSFNVLRWVLPIVTLAVGLAFAAGAYKWLTSQTQDD